MFGIVTPDSGSTILLNIVDNQRQCGLVMLQHLFQQPFISFIIKLLSLLKTILFTLTPSTMADFQGRRDNVKKKTICIIHASEDNEFNRSFNHMNLIKGVN